MRIDGLKATIDKYDSFIIDVWGVLYDGRTYYEGVPELLDYLQDKKKVFLSNSPRPSSTVFERLNELGLNIRQEDIFTSGDFFREKAHNGEFKDKIFYVIGAAHNKDILDGIEIKTTEDMAKANAAIVLMFVDDEQELQIYRDMLDKAKTHNLEVFCPNPDKIVSHADGIRYTGGYFAKYYETIGGKVSYFGKPHRAIYEHVINKFSLRNTLAIGDSLETDIAGAKNLQLDSVLLLCGIHKNEHDINKLINELSLKPTYITNSFRL